MRTSARVAGGPQSQRRTVKGVLEDQILTAKRKFTCEYCKKEAMDLMIECEACMKWACLHCQNVSVEVFNVLFNTPSLHRFCKRCEHGAIEAAKEASLCASGDIPQPKTGLVEKMIIDVRKEISEVKNELKCMQKAGGSVYAAKSYSLAASSIPASDDSATDPAQNINRNNNVSAKAKVMP